MQPRAGGHSLGGAFALLMACAARMRLQLPPSSVDCYAFGSPPVLARASKADARDVLQVHDACPIVALSNTILKGRLRLWGSPRAHPSGT